MIKRNHACCMKLQRADKKKPRQENNTKIIQNETAKYF